jgi:hypothetical protein
MFLDIYLYSFIFSSIECLKQTNLDNALQIMNYCKIKLVK